MPENRHLKMGKNQENSSKKYKARSFFSLLPSEMLFCAYLGKPLYTLMDDRLWNNPEQFLKALHIGNLKKA